MHQSYASSSPMSARCSMVLGALYASPVASVWRNRPIVSVANGSGQTTRGNANFASAESRVAPSRPLRLAQNTLSFSCTEIAP